MAQQLSTATTGRSVLGFFGVLLMSGVNFPVVRSALQHSMCPLGDHFL